MTRSRSDPLPGNRLAKAILSLQPALYLPLDDSGSPLRDVGGGGYSATVTGSPTYAIAAPSPIGRGVTFASASEYATTSGSVPTPTTALSVLLWYVTTSTTASQRFLAGRNAASQFSWAIGLSSGHLGQATLSQSGGAVHASQTVSGATNDGAWHLLGATFDGTTLRVYRDAGANSTASLTGAWHNASTAGVQVNARNSTGGFVGTIAHLAVVNRMLAATDFAWLYAIGKGA